MKKFSNEQKELLRIAQPITRNWLRNQFKEDDTVTDTIRNQFIFLNSVETNIYCQWHQNCLQEMRREKLNLNVPELYERISDPKVSVTQALTLAQHYYGRKDKKAQQKHTGKMISLIKLLADREKSFYRQASKCLLTETPDNVLERLAKKLETTSSRDSEDLLYTRQSLKHIKVLKKLGFTPSVHEIYQALEPRFANNNELYLKQIQVVSDTYTKGQDVPTEIKDVCFDFIKESIPVAGYFNATLIEYIFKNDTISDKAFQLFVDMSKTIKEHGMDILVHTQAQKLAEAQKLTEKKVTELTDSDIHILKLIEMFTPKYSFR